MTANIGLVPEGLIPEAYAPFAEPIFAGFAQPAAVTKPSDVAEAVWRAANDESGPTPIPGWSGRRGTNVRPVRGDA